MAKPPLPKNLQPLAAKAKARHMKRPVPPKVMVQGEEGRPSSITSPYRKEDEDEWMALLFQAFGTRSIAVAKYFIGRLADLVRRDWDEEARKWKPSQDELDAMIAMVNALKPRNEAQAAYAAQLCTLHLSAMRLASTATSTYSDPRTVAVLNKTVRAFGDGLLNLERLQGRGRVAKQSIKSESYKHVHQHVHLHGGRPGTGGKPCGPRTEAIEASAAMPGEEAFGRLVRLPRDEG
jgi:hypothetical protein